MHKLTQIAAALVVGVSISFTAIAADKNTGKVPFKVNGATVSRNLVDAFVAEQLAKGAADSPELRNAVREELIRRELLVQEAKKAGLDKKSEVTAQVEIARQAVLIRSYVQQFVEKNPIKDEQLQGEYNKIKAQVGDTEYKSRHILVKEESEAQAIIGELKKGAKFEELAKKSTDPGSKDNGGDLGWSAPGSYVKEFTNALTVLKKGKFTETPVKSQFGYHVILLEDTRPMTFPSFEEIKPRLLQQAQQQQITQMVDGLRAKAKVE
jgi:peptidyl-prolyl cis-trans isomerase C